MLWATGWRSGNEQLRGDITHPNAFCGFGERKSIDKCYDSFCFACSRGKARRHSARSGLDDSLFARDFEIFEKRRGGEGPLNTEVCPTRPLALSNADADGYGGLGWDIASQVFFLFFSPLVSRYSVAFLGTSPTVSLFLLEEGAEALPFRLYDCFEGGGGEIFTMSDRFCDRVSGVGPDGFGFSGRCGQPLGLGFVADRFHSVMRGVGFQSTETLVIPWGVCVAQGWIVFTAWHFILATLHDYDGFYVVLSRFVVRFDYLDVPHTPISLCLSLARFCIQDCFSFSTCLDRFGRFRF